MHAESPIASPRPRRASPEFRTAPSLLQRLQQTCGNQAVLRHLAVQRDDGSGSSAPPAAPPARPPARPAVAPTEDFVIPFDSTPLSLPGEEVLFHARFLHPDQTQHSHYQYVYTGVGGKFDSSTGAAAKTLGGLDSGNVPFFIDAAWNGTSAVTVKLELQRKADNSVVKSWNWTFAKKTQLPTTMTQETSDGELPLGSAYDYKLGPDIHNDGKIDYGHQTILESFDPPTANFTLAEIKPEWKRQNPGVTTDAQLVAKLFGGSGANGTFTVDADDKIHDAHGGMPDKADFEAALTTMKEIHIDIVQTYSVKPGVALARFNVRRILKTDGTTLVKKTKL